MTRVPMGSALLLGLLFVPLAFGAFREVGLVGEVAIAETLGRPPAVVVSMEPMAWADGGVEPTAGHSLGPLVASQVRPIEGLRFGGAALPILVNGHTPAIADWPDLALFSLTRSTGLQRWAHFAAGGLLVMATSVLGRWAGTAWSGAVAGMILMTDWAFGFYKAALGGTELALQASLLLLVWGVLAGPARLRWILPLGVGLGLVAKLTFVPALGALAVVAFVKGVRLERRELAFMGVAVLVAAVPYVIGGLHHALAVPAVPHVVSHDFPGVQGSRLARWMGGGAGPARESLTAVASFFGNPLAFFGPAYGAAAPSAASPLRLFGWLLVIVGAATSPRSGVLDPARTIGTFLASATVLLLLVAREMHHLAMLSPILALWVALSLDGLRQRWSWSRGYVLALPLLLANLFQLRDTERVLHSIEPPTFSRSGQEELRTLLATHHVERVVVADYDCYGLLENLSPDVRIEHAWGFVSWKGVTALTDVLRFARGGHFLVVKAAAPLIYNLGPTEAQVQAKATFAGVRVTKVGSLERDRAVLYRVDPGVLPEH